MPGLEGLPVDEDSCSLGCIKCRCIVSFFERSEETECGFIEDNLMPYTVTKNNNAICDYCAGTRKYTGRQTGW